MSNSVKCRLTNFRHANTKKISTSRPLLPARARTSNNSFFSIEPVSLKKWMFIMSKLRGVASINSRSAYVFVRGLLYSMEWVWCTGTAITENTPVFFIHTVKTLTYHTNCRPTHYTRMSWKSAQTQQVQCTQTLMENMHCYVLPKPHPSGRKAMFLVSPCLSICL